MPGSEFGINPIGFRAGSAAGRKSLDVRRWQLPRFYSSGSKSCTEPPLLTIRCFKTDDSSQMARQFCQPLMALPCWGAVDDSSQTDNECPPKRKRHLGR